MNCKTELCENKSCLECDYRCVDSLLECDEMKNTFNDDQRKMIAALFHINEKHMADGVQTWIINEYSNELQKWLIDTYAAEIQNWLEDNFFYVLGKAIKAKFKRLFNIH